MNAVVEQIKAEYAADAAAPKAAVAPSDVPFSYELIEPEWFTAILCREAPGARVVSFELGPPNDGSSNRRQVMLRYNEAGASAGLPHRVFCKAAMRVENRILLGLGGSSLCETNFYNIVRPQLKIDAPVSLHAQFDPRSYAYIIVMEDLTDAVEFGDENRTMNRTQAESMVSLLAEYHAAFYEHPHLNTPALPFARWADWWKVTEEADFERCCRTGFEVAQSVLPESIYARRDEFWAKAVASAERHRSLPETLTHMDGHFSNWYVRPDDSMGLCDWQFVMVGSGIRDFIYGITTGLSVEDRRAWQDDLLKIYLDQLVRKGVPSQDFNAVFNECRRQLMTAMAFWTYTLRPQSHMPDMQTEARVLKYVSRIAQAMEDMGSFDAFR